MRRYAVAGTPTSADLELDRPRGRQGVRARRLRPGGERRRGRLRPEHVRRREPEGVPAQGARHLLGRVLRARRRARGRAQGELPDAGSDALERRAPPRPAARGRGSRPWSRARTRSRRTRRTSTSVSRPLAKSKLVIDNEFRPDLEPELWDGDEITREVSEAGKRLDELDLLPAPFPVHEFLPERDLRHVMRLYQVGGLSYGNLSARKDETRFWMSASGVDKSQLESVGRDILLVIGLRRAERPHRPQRAAGNRAAPCVGRRDRALDDLPAPPRRRRDPPRPRLDGGHPCDRRELSVRHTGARGVRRRADRPRARPRRTP